MMSKTVLLIFFESTFHLTGGKIKLFDFLFDVLFEEFFLRKYELSRFE